jgi:uncharacterized protein (TIGR02996 family)
VDFSGPDDVPLRTKPPQFRITGINEELRDIGSMVFHRQGYRFKITLLGDTDGGDIRVGREVAFRDKDDAAGNTGLPIPAAVIKRTLMLPPGAEYYVNSDGETMRELPDGRWILETLEATSGGADEDAFLAAIEQSPYDSLTRQIYADWLEERKQPSKARFARLSAEVCRFIRDITNPESVVPATWAHAMNPLRKAVEVVRFEGGHDGRGNALDTVIVTMSEEGPPEGRLVYPTGLFAYETGWPNGYGGISLMGFGGDFSGSLMLKLLYTEGQQVQAGDPIAVLISNVHGAECTQHP